MRVTSGTFYDNFLSRQRINLKDIGDVSNRISTGTQIRQGYQDPIKLTDTLKLDHIQAALVQAKRTSEMAQNFADNTDSILGGFVETLIAFKVKMIDASNGNHSITSLNAIAKELGVSIKHLKELANSSVNGHYVLAGSNLLSPPIDDDLKYKGNNDNLSVLVGNHNSVNYNIPGQDLFLGSDGDYRKRIITNVSKYNASLLYPKTISPDNKSVIPSKQYITKDDFIRDLVGDNDDNINNNKRAVFYLRGINTNGDRIKAKIFLDTNDKLSTLTKKISEVYDGFVDVSINKYGQFELRDKVYGNNTIDFHIVSATDYSEGEKNLANVEELDDLLNNKDIYIQEYQKSYFNPIKTAEKITSQTDLTKRNQIIMKSSFIKTNGEAISLKDKVRNILSNEVKSININGINIEGKKVSTSIKIEKDTSMRDLLDKIESVLSVGEKRVIAKFENDKLILLDDSWEKGKTSIYLDLSTPNVMAFSGLEASNVDKIYFHKDKNTLTSNIPQIKRDRSYATRDTTIFEISSSSLMDKTLKIDLKDVDGIYRKIKINITKAGINFEVDNKKFDVINANDTFLIGEESTNSKINLPDRYDMKGLRVGDKLLINGQIKAISEIDEQYRHIILDTPLLLTPRSGDVIKYSDPSFKRVSDTNFTYGQLMDIISMGLNNTFPAINKDYKSYQNAIETTQKRIEIELDDRGRLVIKDLEESLSKIDIAVYDDNSNRFTASDDSPVITLNANNAIVVDEPNVNLFQTLLDSVDAVRLGKVISDGESLIKPRSKGILYSVESIDHLIDHISKQRAVAGSNSKTLGNVINKTRMEIVNTKDLKSKIIDTDLPSAIIELKQKELNYQALLSIANRIEKLTLLKYL